MDSLYSRLAGQWNSLFPPDSERVSFLVGLFEGMNSDVRIIEVGCGTGATAISLATLGYSVAASDLDKDMIMSAQQSAGLRYATVSENYYPEAGEVRFTVDDMIGALEKAPAGSVQTVLCLGNTLAHLTGPGELSRFFKAAASALIVDGTLVIQILNYQRLLRLGSIELPELTGDGLQFRRRQSFDRASGLVVFETEVESGNRTERRTHNLLPLSVEQLTRSAQETGLSSSGVYRDWKGTAYEGSAPWLVSVLSCAGGNQ